MHHALPLCCARIVLPDPGVSLVWLSSLSAVIFANGHFEIQLESVWMMFREMKAKVFWISETDTISLIAAVGVLRIGVTLRSDDFGRNQFWCSRWQLRWTVSDRQNPTKFQTDGCRSGCSLPVHALLARLGRSLPQRYESGRMICQIHSELGGLICPSCVALEWSPRSH